MKFIINVSASVALLSHVCFAKSWLNHNSKLICYQDFYHNKFSKNTSSSNLQNKAEKFVLYT